MSPSEIDAIFAAPPKKKLRMLPSHQRKAPTKSRHPQTIVDPSKKQSQKKRRREAKNTSGASDNFRDSRGSAPRRRTADGYNIYKEDELGISTTGGDTPLCPFDCQCCF